LARLYGYEQIPATLPRALMGAAHKPRPPAKNGDAPHPETIVTANDRLILQKIRSQLLSAGLFEAVNYGFMSAEQLDQLGIPENDRRRQTARLANPLVA